MKLKGYFLCKDKDGEKSHAWADYSPENHPRTLCGIWLKDSLEFIDTETGCKLRTEKDLRIYFATFQGKPITSLPKSKYQFCDKCVESLYGKEN